MEILVALPDFVLTPAVQSQRREQTLAQSPTWKLAGEPDSDCTLTPHFSGSSRNASSARLCTAEQVKTIGSSQLIAHNAALISALAHHLWAHKLCHDH